MIRDNKCKDYELATFAGGCFWCIQPPYDKLDGVISTTVGYIGGGKENPTYEEVCTGSTGHAEAVQIKFDPGKISYLELLKTLWENINPTTKNSQFSDKGSQYRTAIFYHNNEQKELALISKERLESSKKYKDPIMTEIIPAGKFYKAEDYHQNYYKKNDASYKSYRINSGRETYLQKIR